MLPRKASFLDQWPACERVRGVGLVRGGQKKNRGASSPHEGVGQGLWEQLLLSGMHSAVGMKSYYVLWSREQRMRPSLAMCGCLSVWTVAAVTDWKRPSCYLMFPSISANGVLGGHAFLGLL